MDAGRSTSEVKIMTRSAVAGFLAPLCFVLIFAFRQVRRRVNVQFDFWDKRVKRELARWS
jgi:hypothetical protein